MPKDVKVSIITVSYNSEATIARTIESVLHQTYKNIEYIIVDGASKDRTVDIIKEYEPFFNGRMRWISEPDDGIYFAMNKGIRMASGELTGIINSDDYYENDAVEKIVKNVPEAPCAVVYGEMRNLIDGMEESVSIVSRHFLDRRSMNHPACFITKRTYEKYGMFDTQYSCVADYDLFLRYAKQEEIVFVPVYEIIANFCSGGISGSRRAYFDLLKLQVNYGMISKRAAWISKKKAQISGIVKGKKR